MSNETADRYLAQLKETAARPSVVRRITERRELTFRFHDPVDLVPLKGTQAFRVESLRVSSVIEDGEQGQYRVWLGGYSLNKNGERSKSGFQGPAAIELSATRIKYSGPGGYTLSHCFAEGWGEWGEGLALAAIAHAEALDWDIERGGR